MARPTVLFHGSPVCSTVLTPHLASGSTTGGRLDGVYASSLARVALAFAFLPVHQAEPVSVDGSHGRIVVSCAPGDFVDLANVGYVYVLTDTDTFAPTGAPAEWVSFDPVAPTQRIVVKRSSVAGWLEFRTRRHFAGSAATS